MCLSNSCHGGVDAVRVGEVVARRETVLGVEADLQPFAADLRDQRSDLFKGGADVRSHARAVFDDEPGAFGAGVQNLLQRVGRRWEHGVESFALVAARVKDDARSVDRGRCRHVLRQTIDGLLQLVG